MPQKQAVGPVMRFVPQHILWLKMSRETWPRQKGRISRDVQDKVKVLVYKVIS
jgi:hypothetical protein